LKNPVVSNTITPLSKSGSPYTYKLLHKDKTQKGSLVCNHIYTFHAKDRIKYVVNLLEYRIGVFGVKFHLKKHHKHPNKYKALSKKGDAIVVLKTIVAIMLEILSFENNASFAFIGMPLETENIEETKRFIVYRLFCQRYFSYQTFDHVYDEKKSFYMLLNKKVNTEMTYAEILKVAEQELQEEISNLPNLGRSTS